MSPPGDRRRQASQRFAELDVDAILEVAAQMGLIERARRLGYLLRALPMTPQMRPVRPRLRDALADAVYELTRRHRRKRWSDRSPSHRSCGDTGRPAPRRVVDGGRAFANQGGGKRLLNENLMADDGAGRRIDAGGYLLSSRVVKRPR